MVDDDQLEDAEVETKARRPGTRGLKRALQKERESTPKLGWKNFDELIIDEINQDIEYWLDRVNGNLEKLLKKSKKNNDLQRHMANNYCSRNKISQIRLKQYEEKSQGNPNEAQGEG